MAMQPPNFGHGDHLPVLGQMDWSGFWTIHRQRQMRAKTVIIVDIFRKQTHEMLGVEDHHVIKEFPADTADEAFHIGILPALST
jgi:hypothetical protein